VDAVQGGGEERTVAAELVADVLGGVGSRDARRGGDLRSDLGHGRGPLDADESIDKSVEAGDPRRPVRGAGG